MNISVFYHIALVNDFKTLIQEQITNVIVSGLYEECSFFFIGVVYYKKEDLDWVIRMTHRYKKINILQFKNGMFGQSHTQASLLRFSEQSDSFILYFHSKGVLNRSYNSDLWRMMMDYYLIHKWKDCVRKLTEGYDTVGVLYREAPVAPHYSGNFWWTTSSYIKTLNHEWLNANLQGLGCEFWIASNKNAKHCCLYEFNGIDPYREEYLLSSYITES